MLSNGDIRLLEDLHRIDDRGLEFAEAIIHQHRYQEEVGGREDERTLRAITALDGVRNLTRESWDASPAS